MYVCTPGVGVDEYILLEYIMFVHHTRRLSIMYESIIHPVYIYILHYNA